MYNKPKYAYKEIYSVQVIYYEEKYFLFLM
jgi:hypothetical protein